MKFSLGSIRAGLKDRLDYYRAIYQHPRTPRLGKVFLWMALAYLLSPIDIIPDFIPVLGHLDDLVVVPALILLALWMIPEEVLVECRGSDLWHEGGSSHPVSLLEEKG